MLKTLEKLAEYISCSLRLGASPRATVLIFWHLTKNFRVRLGLAHHEPQKIYSIDTVYGQLYFRDNFGDITNLSNLLYRETYRWKTLQTQGAILDIGANIGLAAVWFGVHNPDLPVYCFEPLLSNTRLIAKNWPKAKVFPVAVGSSSGQTQLHVDRHGVMASLMECRWDTAQKDFDTVPLDAVVEAEGISKIAVIKIDAEGMEVEILRGAHKTLEKTARVVLETHSRILHQQVVELLQQNGFVIESNIFQQTTGMLFAVKKF